MVQTTVAAVLGFFTKWGQRRAEKQERKHQRAMRRIEAQESSWTDEYALLLLTAWLPILLLAALIDAGLVGVFGVAEPVVFDGIANHLARVYHFVDGLPEKIQWLIYGGLTTAVGAQSLLDRITRRK